MNYSRGKRFLSSEKGLVLAGQAVVSGSVLLTNLLVARALGLMAYGQFSAIELTQLFLLVLQQSVGTGIYQVVWPGLPAALQKGYTNGLFYFQLAWLLGLALLGMCCVSLLPASSVPYHSSLLVAAAGATVLFLLQDFIRRALLVQQQTRRAFALDVLTNGGQMLLLIGFYSQGLLSLLTVLWIAGVTRVPSLVLGLYWLNPGAFRRIDGWLVCAYYRQQGSWMLLTNLTHWLAGNYFVVAGGWQLGAVTLGAIRLAQHVLSVVNGLLQALERYVVPRATLLASNPMLLLTYLRGVLIKSLVGLLPILLLLAIGSEALLTGLGRADYQPFVYGLYGLSAVYILVVCSYPIRILLRIRFLTRPYFIGYVLATVSSLTSASWLIETYQLNGIFIGLVATQAIQITYWLWVLHHSRSFFEMTETGQFPGS